MQCYRRRFSVGTRLHANPVLDGVARGLREHIELPDTTAMPQRLKWLTARLIFILDNEELQRKRKFPMLESLKRGLGRSVFE